MEVTRFILISVLISILASCSNAPELETGEIKILEIFDRALKQSNQSKQFIDARFLLNRKQIDEAKVPVLFIELPSGQNGTLTPYPGQGVGQTWLSADGATITLDGGIVKASRGMGDDIMGSSSNMPKWSKIDYNFKTYKREVSYLNGNNKIYKRIYKCNVQKSNKKELIKIWEVEFLVTKFAELCDYNGLEIQNFYYLDDREIVRKSSQYHSDTLGYISTQRLDRL